MSELADESHTPTRHKPYAYQSADDLYGADMETFEPMTEEYQPAATAATRLDMDEERTPVVQDTQVQIATSTLPAVPGARTVHPNPSVLQSPFRAVEQQYYVPAPGMPEYYGNPSYPQYYIDPVTGVPTAFAPMQMQYSAMYPSTHMQPYPHDYHSRHGSPSSSSMASLTRTGSTSSDMRPKVKLTHQDKRNIVELHRTNSSLRQEDIARQYGVDRSTISKIILQAHRWTAPMEQIAPPVPRTVKTVGGRFPAIEQKMHEWMDRQIAQGMDVRDNIARDQAKAFAREIGFPMERFKASAKWLDKFKDRRKAAGKPTTSMHVGYYYQGAEGGNDATGLSRTQSSVTLSSGSSEYTQISPNPAVVERMQYTKSETDLTYGQGPSTYAQIPTHIDMTPTRQRSQSSPQIEPGVMSPSSGKAVKPSPLALQRQNSYHGAVTSPRRPAPLSRSATSTLPVRRSRPGSLAASAFGITPIGGDETPISPSSSAGTSVSRSDSFHAHSRGRSDTTVSSQLALTPFTTSMGVLAISPDVETPGTASSASSQIPMPLSIPPLTPNTPINAQGMPTAYTADFASDFDGGAAAAPYGTMPNKHYAPHAYAYPTTTYQYYPQQQSFAAQPSPHTHSHSHQLQHQQQHASAQQHTQTLQNPQSHSHSHSHSHAQPHVHAHAHAHEHTHSPSQVQPHHSAHAQSHHSSHAQPAQAPQAQTHHTHTLHHPQPMPHLNVAAQIPVMTDFGPSLQYPQQWQ